MYLRDYSSPNGICNEKQDSDPFTGPDGTL